MLARLTLIVLLTLFAPLAHAASPKSSTLVSAIDFEVPYHVLEDSGPVLGLAECETLAEQTNESTFVFELTVDPTEVGEAGERLADAWLFELDPNDSAITCEDDACIPLEEEVSVDDASVTIGLDPDSLLQGAGCERDRDVFVRVALRTDLDEDDVVSADARLRFDVTPPPGREISNAEATDNTLEVQFTAVDDEGDAESWHVGWAPADVSVTSVIEVTRVGGVAVSADSASLDGVELPLDVEINIYVWSTDAAGNASPLSVPFVTVPADAVDYWEAYGDGDASCSNVSGSATWLAFLALLPLGFRRRRWFTVLALALFPATVSAETAIIDVRAGTYAPAVSNSEGFQEHFGDELRAMASLDGAWFFYQRPLANVGLDAGVGYSRLRGDAFTAQGSVVEQGSTLSVVPMRLGLRLTLGERVPWLAASFRGGLTSQYFRFSDPGGDVSVATDGTKGRGMQWGWYTSALIGLDLNGFDRGAASKMSLTWGIERTILFVEVAYSRADDFGASWLNVGALQANAGLGFGF